MQNKKKRWRTEIEEKRKNIKNNDENCKKVGDRTKQRQKQKKRKETEVSKKIPWSYDII